MTVAGTQYGRPQPRGWSRDTQRRWLVAALLIVVLFVGISSWSQEDVQEDRRPRIGLVLSGGGARGTAHVGVLKVLEELNIPVHFVAGTSMGAIVGGLYSAGLSPAEMEQILSEVDWRRLLDDKPDRREMPYRRKVDDQTYLTRFEVGFNRGSFQMPSGLISGQELDFAIQAMALRTAGIDDFDKLPIPFRAIATDIRNGEMVVLAHGDLGRAIRASMSIPAVFSPVEIDGRLLVDGGLVRNLPIDIVREMGADVVIAVDVGAPMGDGSEEISLTQMTGQLIGLQIWKNVQEQRADADVLISPDLGDFKSSQFEKALEMMPAGEVAAREAAATLSEYSVPEAEYAAYMAEVRKPVPAPEIVSSVQLTAASTTESDFVFRKVRTRPGDAFDLEAVRADLRRLYDSGDFEKVNFFLTGAEDDLALHIEAQEKPWGPNYLRFGINLFADFEGEGAFDLLASYTMTRLNRLRAEAKFNVQLGEHPSVTGEFYQPLTHSGTWFVAPWLGQANSTIYTPVDEGLWARYRSSETQGGLDLGLQLGKYAELRFGLVRSTGEAELRQGIATSKAEAPPSDVELDYGGYRFIAVVDQFDNMNFPRHGYFAVLSYLGIRDNFGSEADFDQVMGFFGGAASRQRHSGMLLVNLHSALGSDSPALQSFGGLFKLSGYAPGVIAGRYGGSASLLYLFRLSRLPPGFGDGIYIGASVEAGNLWLEQDQMAISDLRYAGSLFVGVDTALGPLYLAAGFGEGGADALYLYVGRTF